MRSLRKKIYYLLFGGVAIFLVAGVAMGQKAHAAPLNFATAETIMLSSPAATLIIATGSVADALQINATSVAVTLSQATGGNFIIFSPAYDLSVDVSNGSGGTSAIACNSLIDTVTLSQGTGSETYTILPVGTNCAGGNVASSSTSSVPAAVVDVPQAVAPAVVLPPPIRSTISSSSDATNSLEAEIASLQAKLQALLAEQHDISGGPSSGSGSTSAVFFHTLTLGSRGGEVSALQRALLKDGDYPQAIISGYFGMLTQRAVEAFQKKYHIVSSGSPSTTGFGVVGPKTRVLLNRLF